MFTISEDTFTPYAEKKLNTVDVLHYNLMNVLTKAFFENVDPFVPIVSGSLLRSAHHFVFVDSLEAMNIVVEWTGRYNQNDNEFETFWNRKHEDYALSVYYGKHYKRNTDASSSLWVEQGLETFDEDELESLMKQVFGEFLMK